MVYITLSINETYENEAKNDEKNENIKKSFKRNLLSDLKSPRNFILITLIHLKARETSS